MKWLIAGIAVIVVTAAFIFIVAADADPGERADVTGQGGNGPVLAVNGARLVRSGDGLHVYANVPTPRPGSYEYPTGDMVPETASPHPEVLTGGPDEPEVFTMWAFVFNFPDLCTESCNLDDLAEDAPARGGVYQADGHIADQDRMELVGSIRIGQTPANGSVFENPLGAEVHLAIAPHGKMLAGTDGWRQLNGPLGNPTLWWAATFLP